MLIEELFSPMDSTFLIEMEVLSSWIEDLDYTDGGVNMLLHSGNEYHIHGVSKPLYDRWIKAPSPGKFWHRHIVRKYTVTREN